MEDFKDAKVYGPGSVSQNEADTEQVVMTGLSISQSAVESITRGEIDMQIATAHKYPRSIKRFQEEARTMATIDEETAESCFYSIPRDGKMIEGPSIRLMEIAASAWGNIRYGSRTIGEDQEFVTSQGVAHDLERNVAITVDVRRRITKSNGKRYGSDMIAVTANAGGSVARRNALLGVIPRAYINPIYDEVKKVAVGSQQTLVQKRENAIAFFSKLGVTAEQLYAKLDVSGKEDISLTHLGTLLGLRNAIKENEISIDEAFPKEQTVKVSGDADALKKATPTQQTTGSGTIPSTPKQETKPEPETIETAKVPSAKRPYSLAFGNNNNVYLLRKEKEEFDKKYGAKAVQFVIDEFDGDIQANNGQQTYSNHQPEVARILGEKFGAGEQGKLI
jgi:hypothetical protein